MISYKEYKPDHTLKSIIKCYWLVENSEKPHITVEQKIIPDNYIDIIYNFGDRYLLETDNEEIIVPQSFVVGMMSKPVKIKINSKVKIFGIRLNPGYAYSLFRLNLHELSDTRIEVTALRKEIAVLINSICEKHNNIEGLINSMNEMFRNLRKNWFIDHEAIAIVSLIERNMGGRTISEIAQSLGISKRQIERKFNKYIGLSPKIFSRITRFQQTVKQINSHFDQDFATIPYHTGFYDQSHFIKDFKRFSGDTPAYYLRSIQDYIPANLVSP